MVKNRPSFNHLESNAPYFRPGSIPANAIKQGNANPIGRYDFDYYNLAKYGPRKAQYDVALYDEDCYS